MKHLQFLLIVPLVLMQASCENPPPALEVADGLFELNIRPTVNGQSFFKGILYANSLGQTFSIEECKLYLSNITLIKEGGEEILLSEIELFDVANPDVNKIFHGEGAFKQYQVEAGKYAGLTFSIGVQAENNHSDPSSLSVDHPLSISKDMHANPTFGYFFVKIQGIVNQNPQIDNLTKDLDYKLGGDQLFKTLFFQSTTDAFEIKENQELQYTFELDLGRLIDNTDESIDLLTFNETSSGIVNGSDLALAEKLMSFLSKHALIRLPF